MDAVAATPTTHHDDKALTAQTLYGRSISTRLSSALPLPYPEEGTFLGVEKRRSSSPTRSCMSWKRASWAAAGRRSTTPIMRS